MRLIDVDELFMRVAKISDLQMNGVTIAKAIGQCKTIEAEPVRHGRWICNYIDNYECSVCGALHNLYVGRTKYCHNCGARMDGEET